MYVVQKRILNPLNCEWNIVGRVSEETEWVVDVGLPEERSQREVCCDGGEMQAQQWREP